MNKASIKDLLDKYLTETLTATETVQFRQLLEDEEQVQILEAALKELFNAQINQEYTFPEADQRIEQHVMAAIQSEEAKPLYRRLLSGHRWKVAASFLILITVGTYYLYQRSASPEKIIAPKGIADIKPGKKGAILTLANGQNIQLDTIVNGTIALQGNQLVKIRNGELLYDGSSRELAYNTVSTPNGRQFQLILPDGTKVWLNAGSRIRYPLSFIGKERNVDMTGEGYFEVAQNAGIPFIVNVNGKAKIEVLGTGFNINAYTNENKITTTLLEGRIRVAQIIDKAHSVLLNPGQQALIQQELSIVSNVNVEKVIAWKNNLFDFEDCNLDEVMHQLERWYDIEVVYAGQQPAIQFTGKISRNMTLKNLLTTLEVSGVKCQLEGRKLVVFP